MLRHKKIERICCAVMACTLLLTCAYMGAAAGGLLEGASAAGYEGRLFDTSFVHTIDIVIDDWEGFLENCTDEEYVSCSVVIDGEAYSNVGLRAKGNTSLSSVASYGNDRYSFKIEFDHYQNGRTYYGLDKLSLNNMIQDKTYMKDYLAYTLMRRTGAAAPLCSFAQININGEAWGLYLAVEAVEDGFLNRNYGSDHGELYKPDSLSFGGGRGNGRDFDMNEFAEQFEQMMPDGAFAEQFEQMMPDGAFAEQFEQMMPNGEFAFGAEDFDFSDFDPSVIPGQFGADGVQDPDMRPSEKPSASSDPSSALPSAPSGNTEEEGSTPMQAAPGRIGRSAQDSSDGADENMRGRFENRSFEGGGGMSMGGSDVKLQYIDDDPDSYYNIFSSAKTDVTEEDQMRLIESLKIISEGGDIESAVDTEAVIRYLAVHNFLCNGDSYTGSMIHNYYLYEEDGRLTMLPWDYNLAFGAFDMKSSGDASDVVNSPIDSPVSSGDISDRPIIAWIFENEEYTAMYHEIYAEFINDIYDSGWLDDEIVRVSAMIAPYVEQDPTAFFTYEEFTEGISALRKFCSLRCASIAGQLEGAVPSTSEAQRTDSASLIDASEVDISAMGEFGMGGGKGFGDMMKRGETASGKMMMPEGEGIRPTVNFSADDSGNIDFGNTDFGNTDSENIYGLIFCVLILCAALAAVHFAKSGR